MVGGRQEGVFRGVEVVGQAEGQALRTMGMDGRLSFRQEKQNDRLAGCVLVRQYDDVNVISNAVMVEVNLSEIDMFVVWLSFGVVEINPGTVNRQQQNGRKQPY